MLLYSLVHERHPAVKLQSILTLRALDIPIDESIRLQLVDIINDDAMDPLVREESQKSLELCGMEDSKATNATYKQLETPSSNTVESIQFTIRQFATKENIQALI